MIRRPGAGTAFRAFILRSFLSFFSASVEFARTSRFCCSLHDKATGLSIISSYGQARGPAVAARFGFFYESQQQKHALDYSFVEDGLQLGSILIALDTATGAVRCSGINQCSSSRISLRSSCCPGSSRTTYAVRHVGLDFRLCWCPRCLSCYSGIRPAVHMLESLMFLS